MKTKISALLFLLISQIILAQTGFKTDFSDGISQVTVSSSKLVASHITNLQINATSVGASFENFKVNFSAIDIRNIPKVKVSIKTSGTINLRVDLIDQLGRSTNASPVVKAVSGGFTSYEFDFTGKTTQNWPTAASVNHSEIVGIALFINPGGTNFTGQLNINSIIVGDENSIPAINYLSNQVAYDTYGPKKALCSGCEAGMTYSLKSNGTTKYTGTVAAGSSVNSWGGPTWNTIDFSEFKIPGTYSIDISGQSSRTFKIEDNALFQLTSSGPISFFNGMRSMDNADYNLSFNGPRNDQVNVYGGWWDANGDPGKHMSHLSFANHFNPQQIPLVVWSMLEAQALNDFGDNSNAVTQEINWGVDYLIRNVDNAGYLYLAIFDNWGGDPETREICEWGAAGGKDSERSTNFQAAMREGAGIAIAALARTKIEGFTKGTEALAKAEILYNHLKSQGNGYATKNLEYCNNHTENIIDIYCGLLASCELFKATQKEIYKTDAKAYARRLIALQGVNGELYSDENSKNRPFYHAADEGLPIVSLSSFLEIDKSLLSEIKNFSTKWLSWYQSISYEVNNPFDYVRQYNKSYVNGSLQAAKKSFFLPHDNETEYWWQGENARLASMTTALLTAKHMVDTNFVFGTDDISKLAVAQIDWILGKNPMDICMMHGYGQKNYPSYLNGVGNKKVNQIGGICNGITSDVDNELKPTFMPYEVTDWQNWRWIEQWLPHDAWYLLAVSKLSEFNPINNVDCALVPGGMASIDKCNVCSGGTTRVPVDDCLLSVSSQDQEVTTQIYPNPVHQKLEIVGYIGKAQLYSFIGEVVSEIELTGGSIDVSQLNSGMYYLVLNDNTNKVLRFVKE